MLINSKSEKSAPAWLRLVAIGALILIPWTFFGLLNSFQMFVNTEDERGSYPLSLVLKLALGNNLLKGVISLPFIWLFYVVPIPITDWKRRGVLYLLLFPVFAAIHAAVRPLVIPVVLYGSGAMPKMEEITFSFTFWVGLRSFFVDNAWSFFSVVLSLHLWQYARQARERALNESRLETRLASAELQILKMQLQPHFLFNTLNTIYNLIPINGREAQKTVARLSDLLRFSLDHVTTEKITLDQELAFLMEYVGIEKVRFEERLRVEQDVAADTLHAEVPNMILQPLVENAIRHGIGKKAAGGLLRISARRENGRLAITITDDGVHPAPADQNIVQGTGIGLANTRARLTKLYGENFHFSLEPQGQGTCVRLSIPFEETRVSAETA